MHELLRFVLTEVKATWRYRWWALLTAWFVSALAWAAVSLIRDTYEAQSVVFVDVSSRLDKIIGGVTIERDMQEQLDLVRQEMLSRPVLAAVARATDLDLQATSAESMSDLLESLQQRIVIEESRRNGAPRNSRIPTDSIFTIRFSDHNRETALAVVQNLLDTFVRDIIRGGQTESDEAQRFLVQRIYEYEEMLRQREQALAGFKQENVGLLPGHDGDYFQRLQALMDELAVLESDLRTAENRREALRAQLGSEQPRLPEAAVADEGTAISSVGVNFSGNDLESRISELEMALDDLLLRYTEQHPEVRATRQQLEILYQRHQEAMAALAAAGGSAFEGSALSTNPVYQSIQIALNDVTVEIAALQTRVDDYRSRIAELREKVDIMPEIEARLAGLVRDYDQVKGMHDELISRLGQERLGSAAVAGDVNFRVIEPPIAGFQPLAPNRPVMLLGGLVFGGGAGVSLAYLLSLLRPVFATRRTLREHTGYPVLGSVVLRTKPADRLGGRAAHVAFVGLSFLLIVTAALIIVFETQMASFLQALAAGVYL